MKQPGLHKNQAYLHVYPRVPIAVPDIVGSYSVLCSCEGELAVGTGVLCALVARVAPNTPSFECVGTTGVGRFQVGGRHEVLNRLEFVGFALRAATEWGVEALVPSGLARTAPLLCARSSWDAPQWAFLVLRGGPLTPRLSDRCQL